MRILLETLFPPVCVACDRYASYFCKDCQDQIDFLFFQPKFPPLEGLIDDITILGFFAPPLSTVIKAFKYQSLFPIGPILGDLLYKHLQLPTNIDFVTAVPLHPKRQRLRGYNQAELIAQQVAKKLNKPYKNILVRLHHTQNLASTTSDEERQKLTHNLFALHPQFQETILGKNILLIDDVITTGSTLSACAIQLKQAGAEKIFSATVAHEG